MATPPSQAQRRPTRQHSAIPRPDIHFLHPGYDGMNRLLALPRVDVEQSDDATRTYGVHHGTALLACQITAGNAFKDSYLAVDKAGQQRVVDKVGILTGDSYYFIVPGIEQYAVVPSFQDWEFPHDRIPQSWPAVGETLSATESFTCSISNANYALEEAHIVPKEEADWYLRNDMGRYGSTHYPDINNRVNIFPLKKDIRRVFDDRWFVIVPKTVTTISSQPSSQYVTHIILRDAAELWPTHHTIIVEGLHAESCAYLFARFAWAILLGIKSFINTKQKRRIRVVEEAHGKVDYVEKERTGKQLMDDYGGGGSKKVTPMKRKSGPGSTQDSAESSGGESSDDYEILDQIDKWDSWLEARRRNEMSSEETAPNMDLDTKAHLTPGVEADPGGAVQQVTSLVSQEDSHNVEMTLRPK